MSPFELVVVKPPCGIYHTKTHERYSFSYDNHFWFLGPAAGVTLEAGAVEAGALEADPSLALG